MIKKLTDYSEQVINHHETGTSKGVNVGFKCLDEIITLKPGYSTYILGFPGAGKTELHLEMLFNTTVGSGWRHAILSPEIGGIEDVIAELVSKHLRRPFFANNPFAPTKMEIYNAIADLSQSFYPMDNDEQDYDINSFFEDCEKLEKDHRIKLNTTSIDPWNDLTENLSDFGGREDKYLAWALKRVRQDAKKNKRHNFVVTHAKDMPSWELKSISGGKVTCTAIPTLQSFAGGQVWSRRGFNVLGIWRAEEGAIDPKRGIQFEKNEALILSLKSKPKGSGRKGSAHLYFDWKTNRYYEKIGEHDFYAFEHEKPENQQKIADSSLNVKLLMAQMRYETEERPELF